MGYEAVGSGKIESIMVREAAGAAISETESSEAEYQSFSDLSGKTVSMLTGAPFEELVPGRI